MIDKGDSRRQSLLAPRLALSLGLLGSIGGGTISNVAAFRNPSLSSPVQTRIVSLPTLTQTFVTNLDKEIENQWSSSTSRPAPNLVSSSNLPDPSTYTRADGHQTYEEQLDLSSYENALLSAWDEDISLQKGFDWEIEKLRRYFAGLRQRPDGQWVRTPSLFDFLVTNTPKEVVGVTAGQSYERPPKPVNVLDVGVLIVKNILNGVGFGPTLGMAAVPNAVIQKYEGSFCSFIKGVLGGDLQTLAGGPLFLLLAKYYQDYGPIFNLSFGPKSFLVISDPVMARHILRDCSPEQYCKGMLSEILEPIMGDGLIPADPKIWKVRHLVVYGWAKVGISRFSLL